MNRLKTFCILFLLMHSCFLAESAGRAEYIESHISNSDSLPSVLTKNHADLLESRLRNQAILQFGTHQLPDNLKDWEAYRSELRKKIIQKTGLIVNQNLPLDIKETGSIQMKGYQIKNIAFQTRPGVYATANLYVPEGKGPFPAVIVMHGHWPGGRLYESFQAIGQSLALNGYVCLNIDAWGAGERTRTHGKDEYHGANLGASLLNIGESLIGVQISDNMRGVDLLSSLPYVDSKNIGATGASGGGNQTMWLASMDDRVKVAMPVVSVGTFESCVMRSNCICELLTDGMTFTEQAGVLALVAPRAIKMANIIVDNPTFLSSEMLRSFNNSKPIFKMLAAENNISNLVLDKTHGYWPENREVLLGLFDLQLKGIGTGAPKKEIPFETLPNKQLLVFPVMGKRDLSVQTTADYCERRGKELRASYLGLRSFDASAKQNELRNILRINEVSNLKKVHKYTSLAGWDRLALETSDNKLIPLLLLTPADPSLGYLVIINPAGKGAISEDLVTSLKKKGQGIVIADLSGTGEASSFKENITNKSMVLHTQSRAELWLGKTILGEWVKELNVVSDFLKSRQHAQKVSIDGSKEAGLAGLFLAATGGNVDDIILRDSPLSYLFDNQGSIDFFSMGIHLPGFLNWGDVSLAAALSGKNIRIINPVTMSGVKISDSGLKEYKEEFAKLRTLSGKQGKTIFY